MIHLLSIFLLAYHSDGVKVSQTIIESERPYQSSLSSSSLVPLFLFCGFCVSAASFLSKIYVLALRSSPFHPPPPSMLPNVLACLYPGYALLWNLKLLPTFSPTCRARSRMFHNSYGSPSNTVTMILPDGARSGSADVKKPTSNSAHSVNWAHTSG